MGSFSDAAAAEEISFGPIRGLASVGATPVKEVSRDAALLHACQQGDAEACRLVVRMHQDRVYSLALYLCHDEATAKDITQQAFLTLLAKAGEFRGDAKISTWLYRLVVNLHADERRRLKRWRPLEVAREVMTEQPPQLKRLTQEEAATAIRKAVEALKPKLRVPILLKYLDDLSYQEIADVLGCSPGTVASRLNRGHRALARKLAYLRHLLAGEE